MARHGGICGALDPAQLARLKQHAHRHVVEPGTALADPSTTNGEMSVILSGAVKLLKMLPDGRQQIVGMQYAPDFLGRPFLNQSDVTVEAVTETRLCSFSRAEIEHLIEDAPGLEHRLYLQALAELEEAREMLLTLGRRTARERVATFLLFVARHTKGEDSSEERTMSLLLTRAEIADFLGLTIETVSRQLHQLEAAGIVKLEHNRVITILDAGRLHAESGETEAPSGPAANGDARGREARPGDVRPNGKAAV